MFRSFVALALIFIFFTADRPWAHAIDRFNFEEEYEILFRDGIKACLKWEDAIKLLPPWLADRDKYPEAVCNASQVARNADAAQKGLFALLLQLKQKGGFVGRAVPARGKAGKQMARKMLSGEKSW